MTKKAASKQEALHSDLLHESRHDGIDGIIQCSQIIIPHLILYFIAKAHNLDLHSVHIMTFINSNIRAAFCMFWEGGNQHEQTI